MSIMRAGTVDPTLFLRTPRDNAGQCYVTGHSHQSKRTYVSKDKGPKAGQVVALVTRATCPYIAACDLLVPAWCSCARRHMAFNNTAI